MEAVSTFIFGTGVLLMLLNVFLGIVELLALRTIRPPERRSFAHIRLTQTQYQTVFAPALGALISGLFVSLSASFFYASFSSESEEWQQPIGLILFIAGAVALTITLRSVFKEAGDPSALARDPFTIRAAAEEFTANPRRGTLRPGVLTEQLHEWARYIEARSMNLSLNAASSGLKESLTRAAEQRRFWSSIPHSLRVYLAARRRFPVRFGWPIFSFAFFAVGTIWVMVGYAEIDFTSSVRPWFAAAFLCTLGIASTLFYCATRGNRARLWHRINQVALTDAQKAIGVAEVAEASVLAEEVLLQQVLTRADSFLRQDQPVINRDEQEILRLGKFRVVIVRTH